MSRYLIKYHKSDKFLRIVPMCGTIESISDFKKAKMFNQLYSAKAFCFDHDLSIREVSFVTENQCRGGKEWR